MSTRLVIETNQSDEDQLCAYVDGVLKGCISFKDLMWEFSRPINDGGKFSSRQILNNSSESFYVGDKRYDRAYFMRYVVERGTSYESGTLDVIYKETGFSYKRSSAGDETGISFQFVVDGNNINMIAAITNATDAAILKITTNTIGK